MTTACTSLKCVEEVEASELKDSEKWTKVKKEHDRQNSIPIIAKCLNVGKKAYRLESLNKRIFFVKHGGNPLHRKGEHFTVDLPVWLAKKEGIIILD